jgi:hypothetical protein
VHALLRARNTPRTRPLIIALRGRNPCSIITTLNINIHSPSYCRVYNSDTPVSHDRSYADARSGTRWRTQRFVGQIHGRTRRRIPTDSHSIVGTACLLRTARGRAGSVRSRRCIDRQRIPSLCSLHMALGKVTLNDQGQRLLWAVSGDLPCPITSYFISPDKSRYRRRQRSIHIAARITT